MLSREKIELEQIKTSMDKNADIVLFGLMNPERGLEYEYAERMMELSEGLKSVVYIRNASRFSGKLL